MELGIVDLLKSVPLLGVLFYVWQDFKRRSEKQGADLESKIAQKADKAMAQDIESRIVRQIEKIEDRQNRDVDGLRTEMADLSNRMGHEMASMRTHMDGRFDQMISLLSSNK